MSGGTISPGASPGTLSPNSATWSGGGTYRWEINNATGAAGANWDLLSLSSTLLINATPDSRFTLKLTSLTLGNVAGNAASFDPATSYSFTLASSASIDGWNPNVFALDTSGFTNAFDGTWSIAASGGNLQLVYSAIPEPGTYAALAGVAALLVAGWRRRVGRAVTNGR